MNKAETYIEFITDQLKAGEVSFERVFERILTKFNLSRPTFAKYWKMAQEKHSEAQKAINEAKLNEYTEAELSSLKSAIMSKHEKQAILAKIIKGELMCEKLIVVKGEVKKVMAKPDAQDIMKAIDIDNKMEGDYTIKLSTKSDVTISFLE